MGPGSYLHISESDNFENVGFSYTIEDNCEQRIQTKIKISSNEFEYDESKSSDFVGNVGAARAFVVVVPYDFDHGASQDPKHFINVVNDSPTVTIIKTVNMIWDTT